MPVTCTQALLSAQTLLEAAGQLCEDPVSPDGQTQLLTASQGVLEGTMKVRKKNELTDDKPVAIQ